MSCPYCEKIKQRDANIIYEDNLAIIMLAPEPAAKGHLLVIPREHFQIMEQIPDDLIGYLFFVANKASTLIFESLGMQGTNITVNNGVAAGQEWAHFTINVIPRKENDGIDFNFQRSQANQAELDDIVKRLKDETDFIGKETTEKTPEIIEEEKTDSLEADEEDYRLKQVRHVP